MDFICVLCGKVYKGTDPMPIITEGPVTGDGCCGVGSVVELTPQTSRFMNKKQEPGNPDLLF